MHPSPALPESTGTHDLVVCSSVLAFVDDYPTTVSRVSSLLVPGGHFVQWDWEREEGDADGSRPDQSQIDRALRGAGLTVVTIAPAFEVRVGEATVQPAGGCRGGGLTWRSDQPLYVYESALASQMAQSTTASTTGVAAAHTVRRRAPQEKRARLAAERPRAASTR